MTSHHCYHCDHNANTTFCENWRVWSCAKCTTTHHRAHHVTCAVVLPKDTDAAEPESVAKYFILTLRRYDGKQLALQCRLGQKLEMEDHWMGTYIYALFGIVLVAETRDQINEKILLKLKAA